MLQSNMIDIKKEKIEVAQLSLGMFVTELDRPWIESPFMLQGFMLDDQTDLDKMMSLCQFVYIDRTKSIATHFAATTKLDVSIKREGAVFRIKNPNNALLDRKMPAIKKAQAGEKVSFMDIMRDIKNYEGQKNATSNNEDGVMFNMRYVSDTATQARIPVQESLKTAPLQESITKQLVSDIGGFVGGLFSREKLKSSVKDVSASKKAAEAEHDSYRVIIYEEDAPVENEIANIYPVYEQSQIATRDIFEAVANEHELDLSAVSEVLDSMVDSIGRTPDALLWLAKLKKTDDYAYNHALNVSITLMAFANFLAFSKKQVKELGLAGLLQDIGKVKISSDILLKQGKLTLEEYEYAKKHVDESLKILYDTVSISSEAIHIVAQHHERVDGSGYPNQLSGNQINLAAQAAGLIDTYCAITTHKTYAKGVYHQQALDEIHQLSGKQFSEEIINQLVQFMGMYPVSSLVELNTGEVAVVVQQNQVRRLLPRLMVLLAQDKSRYKAPTMLNLLLSPATPLGEPYRIKRSLPPDSFGLNPADFFL